MRTLCIDIGNSGVKAAFFRNDRIEGRKRWANIGSQEIESIKNDWKGIEHVILCSVRGEAASLKRLLEQHFPSVMLFGSDTAVPFENLYLTTSTLGKDRLAAIAGACNNYPRKNVLVIDAGTAVTFDVIDEYGRYLGGNISPGVNMRFRALNEFTGKLPLAGPRLETGYFARNTEEAIAWGVMNGTLFEIESYISLIRQKFNNPVIILTGGDARYFDKKVKSTIFVDPDLIFTGLNAILKHNASK